MSDEELIARAEMLRTKVAEAVNNTGDHLEFIKQYGAAIVQQPA